MNASMNSFVSRRSTEEQSERRIVNKEWLQELVALEKDREGLKAQLDAIEERQSELKSLLIPQFLNAATTALQVDGKVIELRSSWTASGKSCDVPAAMKAAGLGDMVTESCHPKRLDAYINEIAAQQEQALAPDDLRKLLPEPLQPVLRLYYIHSLQLMKRKKL